MALVAGCGVRAGAASGTSSARQVQQRARPARPAPAPAPSASRRSATSSPLMTDVTRNDTPVVVPTRPFARSRSAAGTSSVTRVGSAMPRRFPAMTPSMSSTTNTHSTRARRVAEDRRGGREVQAQADRVDREATRPADPCMTCCLRWWSTRLPNQTRSSRWRRGRCRRSARSPAPTGSRGRPRTSPRTTRVKLTTETSRALTSTCAKTRWRAGAQVEALLGPRRLRAVHVRSSSVAGRSSEGVTVAAPGTHRACGAVPSGR